MGVVCYIVDPSLGDEPIVEAEIEDIDNIVVYDYNIEKDFLVESMGGKESTVLKKIRSFQEAPLYFMIGHTAPRTMGMIATRLAQLMVDAMPDLQGFDSDAYKRECQELIVSMRRFLSGQSSATDVQRQRVKNSADAVSRYEHSLDWKTMTREEKQWARDAGHVSRALSACVNLSEIADYIQHLEELQDHDMTSANLGELEKIEKKARRKAQLTRLNLNTFRSESENRVSDEDAFNIAFKAAEAFQRAHGSEA